MCDQVVCFPVNLNCGGFDFARGQEIARECRDCDELVATLQDRTPCFTPDTPSRKLLGKRCIYDQQCRNDERCPVATCKYARRVLFLIVHGLRFIPHDHKDVLRCRASMCVDESSVGMRMRHELVGKPNNVYTAFSLFDQYVMDFVPPQVMHPCMRGIVCMQVLQSVC